MAEAYVGVDEGIAKKLRMREVNPAGTVVEQEVVSLADFSGAEIVPAKESGGNLATLAGKDFATETTLATIAGKDFATQTTLAAIKAKTDNIDVSHNLLGKETTLGTVHGHVDSIDSKITAVDTGNVTEKLPTGYATVRVDVSADGDLVAADGTKTIYVLGYQLQGKGDVQVTLRDGVAGTDIGPEWDLNAREGMIVPIKSWPYYYFKTAASGKLSIDVDAAIVVTGNIQYVQQ